MLKYKDTVEDWIDRIRAGLEFRSEYGVERDWRILERMYLNAPNSGADIGPNLIQGMADALAARLGLADPTVNVSPSLRDPRSVETYNTVTSIDSWLMEELDVSDSVDLVILHAFLWSVGVLKLGYDSEWGFDEAFDLGRVDSPWGMTLTQFAKSGSRIEYRGGAPGMPWVMPVFPHDFVVPWGTLRISEAPWVAHRCFRHIDLLRADVKYEKTRDLQPDTSAKDIMKSYETEGKALLKKTSTSVWNYSTDATESRDFVTLWEVRNRITGEIVTLSSSAIHRKDKDRLQVDGVPFRSLSFVRHPRSFWGTPQAQYLLFHQAEQGDMALQASKQRRTSGLKWGYREGAIDDSQLQLALSPAVGVGVKFKQIADIQRDLVPLHQPNNMNIWQEAEASRRNARESIGFSRNQLGEYDSSSRRTATEAIAVSQGAERRMDRKQQAVATLYKGVFRTLNQFLFSFWKTPRLFKVEGSGWPALKGEDIRAEYTYKISFGAGQSEDATTRRQRAFQEYMILRQDPLVNQAELRAYLARVYGDIEFGRLFEGAQGASLPLQMPQLPAGA